MRLPRQKYYFLAVWLIAFLVAYALTLIGCVRPSPVIVPVGSAVILTQPLEVPAGGLMVMDDEGRWIVSEAPATIPAGWAAWYLDGSDLKK